MSEIRHVPAAAPGATAASGAPAGPPRTPAVRHDPHPDRSQVLLAHGERIDWHDHAVHQLIHPSQGVLLISTPGGEWIVPPHRAVWVPASVAHSHTAHGATDMRCVTFGRSVNPLRLDQPTVLAVSPLLREAVAVLSEDGSLPAAHRRHIEQVVLDQLRRVEPVRAHLPLPADPRLRDVMGLLRADPADPRGLTALGRAVGASERTLSRLFRAQTGMTFPQWRTQLRLHHALTLLAAGARVTETAAACGWSGPSPFIQAFRAAFGTTPGLYGRQDADRPPPLGSGATGPSGP